ncbi:MAG: riboflavin synthase [Bacteroidota bacterium]|nr:riboflavin synthase [Candidatus Kapabacteria bacterium]MDW8220592.1 riboflavin synthase [Bacteroidota bacterium]
MFTGLVEEIGVVRSLSPQGRGIRITVAAQRVLHDIHIDDSISINGVCQTVVRRDASSFDVEAVEETLLKTTFSTLYPGKRVNLERALAIGDRLGGHIVQGHVDTRGTVRAIRKHETSWLVTIEFPQEFARYIVPVGSICVDGVSLTVARLEHAAFTVSIIPHTWVHTTLHELAVGNTVNLEFDVLGKYIERMMLHHYHRHTLDPTHALPHSQSITDISEEWLTRMGYS